MIYATDVGPEECDDSTLKHPQGLGSVGFSGVRRASIFDRLLMKGSSFLRLVGIQGSLAPTFHSFPSTPTRTRIDLPLNLHSVFHPISSFRLTHTTYPDAQNNFNQISSHLTCRRDVHVLHWLFLEIHRQIKVQQPLKAISSERVKPLGSTVSPAGSAGWILKSRSITSRWKRRRDPSRSRKKTAGQS